MQAKDIIGKKITDIYVWVETEPGGLDTGKCYLQIDKSFFVTIPLSDQEEILAGEVDERAVSFFAAPAVTEPPQPVKREKTKEEIANERREEKRAFFRQIRRHVEKMAGHENIEREDKCAAAQKTVNAEFDVRDHTIIDFIWDSEEPKSGLFMLDDGSLITETPVALNVLGLAGLNYFESMERLVASGRYNYSDLERITYSLPQI